MESFDSNVRKTLNKKGYRVETELAKGGFATVYRGTMLIDPSSMICSMSSKKKSDQKKNLIAIKVMYLNKLSSTMRKRFLPRELKAIRTFRHQFIVQVFDIIPFREILLIVMEFSVNGDIWTFVRKNGKCTESKAGKWFHQMCLALAYMHEKYKVAHRDMKLNNVLLDNMFDAKLTDFGFSRSAWEKGQVLMSKTMCGTPPYCPPQILKNEPYNPFLDDSWATGVSLFFMLEADFPFDADYKIMVAQQTDYPNYLRSLLNSTKQSKLFKKLIKNMLNPDEQRRATIQDAKQSDWVKQFGLAKVEEKSFSSTTSKKSQFRSKI